jgi:hypothetical protein
MPFCSSLVLRDWEAHLTYPDAEQAFAANGPVTPYDATTQLDQVPIESDE